MRELVYFHGSFQKGRLLSILSLATLQPGKLQVGNGTVLENSLSSYWINPMSVKCEL